MAKKRILDGKSLLTGPPWTPLLYPIEQDLSRKSFAGRQNAPFVRATLAIALQSPRARRPLGQFDRPVGVIEELFPASVAVVVEMNADNRVASGLYRLCDEPHAGLFRGPAALLDVAPGAGTNHIVPSALAAPAPRNNVINGEFRQREFTPAVLTVVAVPGENVSAVELDRRSRQAVVEQQPDDPRHGDIKIDRRDPVVVRLERFPDLAQLPPGLEIIVEVAPFFAGDDLGMVLKEQRKRPAHTNHTQGHVVLVQDKHPAVKARNGLARYHNPSWRNCTPARSIAWSHNHCKQKDGSGVNANFWKNKCRKFFSVVKGLYRGLPTPGPPCTSCVQHMYTGCRSGLNQRCRWHPGMAISFVVAGCYDLLGLPGTVVANILTGK